MTCSRRDFGLLLTALGGVSLSAQAPGTATTQAANQVPVEQLPRLGTKAYIFEELPVRANGKNLQRAVFTGKTHTGFKLECHETDLAPGEENHPPHQHLREEMMLIREGTVELTVAGKPMRLGPGSIGYIGSNEIHNAKNVGAARAQYFIVNIGRDDV
jgi:XRE family transcriptional regulator, regulator of sulfur utilization